MKTNNANAQLMACELVDKLSMAHTMLGGRCQLALLQAHCTALHLHLRCTTAGSGRALPRPAF